MRARRPHVLGLCTLASAAMLAPIMLGDEADAGSGGKSARATWRMVDGPQRGERLIPKQQGENRGAPLFSPDSLWNRPVADAALDPSSHERVTALAEMVESRIELPPLLGGGYPNINADSFSTPIYRVGPNVERVPVRVASSRGKGEFERIAAAGVPIPAGAAPAHGSDGHITIYQPSSDTLWEFWRARKDEDGWHARWGGAMRNVSSSAGYYSSSAWPRLKFPEGWNWGSTATSLPVAAGTVTTQELVSGRINHALAAALPAPCEGVFSWPAQRDDGTSRQPDCMPQGAHLRLDPALNLDSLSLHPVARMLAEAAQSYGIVIRDRTRVSVSFFLESPPPGGPSPYTGPGGIYNGTPSWKVLSGFPWRSLQLLPMRLCSAAPCPPPS